MLVVAFGSLVVLLVVVYLIAAPILRPHPDDEHTDAAPTLVARKERLLTDIRELDMDLATGKLDVEDHRRLRRSTLVQAADALRALEEAEAAAPDRSSTIPNHGVEEELDDDAADDELERLIDARKHELEVRACPECGGPRDVDDAFCRRCGIELETTGVR